MYPMPSADQLVLRKTGLSLLYRAKLTKKLFRSYICRRSLQDMVSKIVQRYLSDGADVVRDVII